MLFFTICFNKFTLTKSSGSKRHAVSLTVPIFAGLCVSHRSWWGEGSTSYSSFPPTPGHTRPHPDYNWEGYRRGPGPSRHILGGSLPKIGAVHLRKRQLQVAPSGDSNPSPSSRVFVFFSNGQQQNRPEKEKFTPRKNRRLVEVNSTLYRYSAVEFPE
jgi:hypothetical protein